MLALPAEALILDRAAFRLRTDQRRIAGAVGLAEGVAAGDQRDGLFVVHRHAEERFADVLGRGDRVRIAVRPFRIDVDQAHLHRAERFGELAFAAVAFVAEPGALRTPVELFRLPHVGAAAGETERLEAHRFQRDVAGENHQVGPGKLLAVFLLDRPQQPARLVEVGVVRPGVERRETLLAGAGAAAAVGDAIGARAMPRHADEQSAVVTEVGRPPVLRVRHQGMQILDHGVEVEGLELLGVIEPLPIGSDKAELRWSTSMSSCSGHQSRFVCPRAAAGERAFASALVVSLCVHVSLRLCSVDFPVCFARQLTSAFRISFPGGCSASGAQCASTGSPWERNAKQSRSGHGGPFRPISIGSSPMGSSSLALLVGPPPWTFVSDQV